AEARPLRQRVARWMEASIPTLAQAEPDLPDELDDRAQDAAEPLLAIADLAGEDWGHRARRALVALRGGSDPEDESYGIQLLTDVREAFDRRGEDRLSTVDLLEALKEDEEAPWAYLRGEG